MTGRLKRCIFSILAVLALGGFAHAEQWQVVQSSGQVWLGSQSVQPASLGSATVLADGATLLTGDRGRVLLARGEDTMVIGPNSHVTLPRELLGRTTILQRAGQIVFDVDKRNVEHFAVETPYLAAIVKGTSFDVLVGPDNSAVAVQQGRVEVKNLFTGQTADIAPGQTAAVRGPRAKLTITGSGAGSVEIREGRPRAPHARPLPRDELATLTLASLAAEAAAQNGSRFGGIRGSILLIGKMKIPTIRLLIKIDPKPILKVFPLPARLRRGLL